MQIRYVNTASTAGGDGTTNNTVGATRAWANLRECFQSFGFGSLSDAYTIYCEGTAADTLSCETGHMGFTTTAANYMLVTTTPANRHDGKYNTSKYRIEVTNLPAIYNNIGSHIRLDGLQVQITVSTSSGGSYIGFRLSTANNNGAPDHRISNCIANIVISGGATDNAYCYAQSDPNGQGGSTRIWNCMAIGGYAGFNSDVSTSVTHYNCTAYGNEFPYLDPMVCLNCLGAGATGGAGVFVGTGSTGHFNNASDDSSAGGTNSRINQTFSFVNAAGGDLHLLSTDAGAKDFGLTDPASGLFSDDIDAQARSGSWDIGADEYYVQARGGLLTLGVGD